MALSTAVITFNISDMIGTDFDARRTKAWTSTNVENDTLIDTSAGQIRLGDGRAAIGTDGTGSFTVWVPGAGANPASWQTYFHFDYVEPGTRERKVRTFGPYTLTGSAALASLEAEQAVPPNYQSGFIAQAQAFLDQQESLAGIDSSDSATAYNTQYGSLTKPALAALFARSVSLAKFLPLGNNGSGVVAAAFASAVAEAGTGGTIFIPKYLGTYLLDAPVSLNDVNVASDGAVISATAAIGTGAAMTIGSPASAFPDMIVGGFDLMGSGTVSLGVKTSNATGIKITGDARASFRDMTVRNFGYGFDLANNSGHIKWYNVTATRNYYGVYCSLNTYDYNFLGCLINGNTFANFATPANQGFGSLTIRDSHIGFAPYGIYQEPTPAAQGANALFLQDAIFDGARFEQIGNGAIVSEATQGNPTNRSFAADIRIQHPGFSWSPASGAGSYRIPGRNKDYAVVLPQTDRIIEIVSGTTSFTAGDLNVYRIKLAGHAAFILRGTPSQVAASQVVVDSGTANVFAYTIPVGNGSSPTFGNVAMTGSLQFSGNNTRIQGDTTSLYFDSTQGASWRDSDAGFAQRMGLTDSQLAVAATMTIKTGRNVTGSRPSASAAGAGATFYDTTLSKPIWSDGTVWRDATGTAV